MKRTAIILLLISVMIFFFVSPATAETKKINTRKTQNPVALKDLLNLMQQQIDDLISAISTLNTLTAEVTSDGETNYTAITANQTLVNDLRSNLLGDYVIQMTVLSNATLLTQVQNTAFNYSINGTAYYKAATDGTDLTPTTAIPQAKYGAFAFDIGSAGTIVCNAAADNATGYDSAALAAAGLPSVASDYARMGYVTIIKSDGAFTPQTTELSAANVTVAYTSDGTWMSGIGSAVSDNPAPKPASTAGTSVTTRVGRTNY